MVFIPTDTIYGGTANQVRRPSVFPALLNIRFIPEKVYPMVTAFRDDERDGYSIDLPKTLSAYNKLEGICLWHENSQTWLVFDFKELLEGKENPTLVVLHYEVVPHYSTGKLVDLP